MRRVQDLQMVALERTVKNLGGEARPTHAEEDDRVELTHGAGRELLELGHALAHPEWLVEPAEPAGLVPPRPERGVASPEALHQLGGRGGGANFNPREPPPPLGEGLRGGPGRGG